MEIERTEDLALRQVLPISVGGERVELRTLSMDESDAWLRKLTGAVDVETGGIEGDADGLARLLGLSAALALELVTAYDVDGVLADVESLRARMTKREVQAALEAMATAEDPFGEGAARLAAEVFGAPSRFLALVSGAAIEAASSSAPSPSGASTPGASTTSATSDRSGAASGSSSSGSTAKTASAKKRRTGATRSRTA